MAQADQRLLLKRVEQILYAGRLLLLPMALGMLLGVAVMLLHFFVELSQVFQWHLVLGGDEIDLIVEIIDLVDVFLLSGLLVIVAISGYDFFVSHIHVRGQDTTPDWVGTVGLHDLKLNLLLTIVAISTFQLLQIFLNLIPGGQRTSPQGLEVLPWLIGLHALFVVTTLVVALLGRAQGKDRSERLAVTGHARADRDRHPRLAQLSTSRAWIQVAIRSVSTASMSRAAAISAWV